MGEISSLFEYVESMGNIIEHKVVGIIAKKRVKT